MKKRTMEDQKGGALLAMVSSVRLVAIASAFAIAVAFKEARKWIAFALGSTESRIALANSLTELSR